ncbi:MAG: hypothetical protein J7641_05285 [Cyanobacteria bacterium SID2]|nr:hypothetical protein [Cyanobacteria bacterium SID2]MBP0006277.1 hypothetical protein [Cyanobacteria bacterium SBC]
MAAQAKRTNKTVTFTSDEGDRALLDRVEQTLKQSDYNTFSELAKSSLQQFFAPESDTTEPDISESDTTEPNTNVTFATEEGDRALFDRVEQTLKQGDYDSFSELAKEALQQFFAPEPDEPPDPDRSETAEVSEALVERVSQLQQELDTLKQHVFKTTTQRLDEIETRVNELAEMTRSSPTDDVEDKVESNDTRETTSLADEDVDRSDPMLSRLQPLLEDF